MKRKLLLIGIALLSATFGISQTYTFTSAGAVGENGPTQTDVNTAYTSTTLDGAVTVTTQGIQEWTVPANGVYQIQAVGASGGNSNWSGTVFGGSGADLQGEFNLTAGQVLLIAVGQQGETDAIGGGGGGTYVVTGTTPLIVAGGGGGASSDNPGLSAVSGNDGTTDTYAIIAGGTGGNGGNACMTNQNNGGGGGGFYTDGATPNTGGTNNNGFGGLSFMNGCVGGQPGRMDGACFNDPYGGFGGGGSGTCNTVGGGGGGGYSGGAGGPHIGNCGVSLRSGGGGGGSYNSGTNPVFNGATNTGDGTVVITMLCTPGTITPDVATLPTVTAECTSTPVAPTASDDCGGTITGTPDVTFPITTFGTTTVTWTYDAGGGLTSTQTQDIEIIDTTAAVPDTNSLPDVTGNCEITSIPAPTATDNCVGSITGTPDVTFPITTSGTTVVTWTFDDGNGNTSTITQNAIVDGVDASVSLTGATLTALQDSATYQWLDCDNSYAPIGGQTNQSFTPTQITGTYAVEVTYNGCVDTSICYLVDYSSVGEIGNIDVKIYPNPSTDGVFNINTSEVIESIQLFDMTGRSVSANINLSEGIVDGSLLESGKYIIQMKIGETVVIKHVVIAH
ncbi:MAG: T9SS type A sorting domain-containing protein [Crocinitomicaceae bacterium]|nr:T9SS type A sorting domain-containing protein [Crocinitomicaceae bacterium]